MKLKPEQMLYVRTMGKALKVTAVFTDDDSANAYMSNHSDEGVVAEFAPYIFIANVYDNGIQIPREPTQ